MKWWKYFWAIICNFICIGFLVAIFSNVSDSNTSKLLAAAVLISYGVTWTGVQLTRQISAGFTATMMILQSVINMNVSEEDTDENKNTKEELDAAIAKVHKDIQKRNGMLFLNGLFALAVSIWMLSILLTHS